MFIEKRKDMKRFCAAACGLQITIAYQEVAAMVMTSCFPVLCPTQET